MKNVVIAISGQPGSGSTTIARKLAKKLKLDYYSPGEIFKKYSKKKESVAALEVWEKLGRNKNFHEKNFDKIQVEKARRGDVVICGKLSLHMLDNIADFKIWIECNQKTRAIRTAKRDRIPVKEALENIKKREKIERDSWRKFYGFDYFDQKNIADFVLENSKLTKEEAVDKILGFMRGRK